MLCYFPHLTILSAVAHVNVILSLELPLATKWLLLNSINSSPPRQNGRHFADDIFRYIFLNEKFYVLISLKAFASHVKTIWALP